MTAKKNCEGRGRPRCFDVDQAIDIAKGLFHERGYDGVGVAELAKAIGINPPSLYAAFGSKHGLFQKVVERYASAEGAFIGTILDRSQSPEKAIRDVLFRAAEMFTADRECRGCLVMDGARNSIDAEARALTSAFRALTRQKLAAWLESRGVRNAEPFADTFMIGMAGLSAAARDGMQKDDLVRAAGTLANGLVATLEIADPLA